MPLKGSPRLDILLIFFGEGGGIAVYRVLQASDREKSDLAVGVHMLGGRSREFNVDFSLDRVSRSASALMSSRATRHYVIGAN